MTIQVKDLSETTTLSWFWGRTSTGKKVMVFEPETEQEGENHDEEAHAAYYADEADWRSAQLEQYNERNY